MKVRRAADTYTELMSARHLFWRLNHYAMYERPRNPPLSRRKSDQLARVRGMARRRYRLAFRAWQRDPLRDRAPVLDTWFVKNTADNTVTEADGRRSDNVRKHRQLDEAQ